MKNLDFNILIIIIYTIIYLKFGNIDININEINL